jgi:1-aminocyclopropane-1-carboxylate deaminase/D-cysteine desulfhydrase-like pyridoxal-dependent ACC family enzyme
VTNFKKLTSNGKTIYLSLDHVTHLAVDGNKTRAYLGVAVGGAEAAHSVVVVDEAPEVILEGIL